MLKGRGVVLNTLSAGDSFGVAGLFTENDRYVSDIRAVRPWPGAAAQHSGSGTALCGRQWPLPLAISGFCPGASASSIRSWDAFTSSSAEGRIVVWLLENMDDSRVVIPRGYSDLSRTLGIGRASLYRCLDGLEAQGALRRQEREIEILRPELLQSRIG